MLRNRTFMAVVALVLLIAGPTMILAAESVKASSGAAKFSVVQKMFVNGNEIKPGSYDVKWEANGSDATVIFSKDGIQALKVQAKIEEIQSKFNANSLVIGKDAAGHEAVKGLQFSGKNVRILFE